MNQNKATVTVYCKYGQDSILWQLNSTTLYKKLCKTLILPSISHLQKLSALINIESGLLELHYLQQKTDILTEMEKK